MKEMLTIQDATDEQLLAELVRRNPMVAAPWVGESRDLDVRVGIGKDHNAHITFFQADFNALRAILAASATEADK